MKLQLGLSLSSSSSSSSGSSKFDLNNYSDEAGKGMLMDALKKRKLCVNGDDDDEDDSGFHVSQTLPLLFCNNKNKLHQHDHQEEEEDDDGVDEVQSTFILVNYKNGGEENGVIGWPPVKSNRKKFCHQKNAGAGAGGSKSKYVKVQMEGVGIARKVDLNQYQSYHTLLHTLARMFGKCNEDVKLTYQDKERDWLLAGDVPWGYFSTFTTILIQENPIHN